MTLTTDIHAPEFEAALEACEAAGLRVDRSGITPSVWMPEDSALVLPRGTTWCSTGKMKEGVLARRQAVRPSGAMHVTLVRDERDIHHFDTTRIHLTWAGTGGYWRWCDLPIAQIELTRS